MMAFNSVSFLLFFPIVAILYFGIPRKYRWAFLLAASYYFYMCWKLDYIIIMIASTLVAYGSAILSEKSTRKAVKKIFFLTSVIFNLGLLFVFKYFNFFSESLQALFNSINIVCDIPTFSFLLPLGISFYTFKIISYSVDVYRGTHRAEKHLGVFALYVAFFPALGAGPIERTGFIKQIHNPAPFDCQRVTNGLLLMAWGFFKKTVIADRLLAIVNDVYKSPSELAGLPVVIATLFLAFQIYCDFSGYCDIAIGASRVLGYRLSNNFNRPFAAKSVSDFWNRWHITLSMWIRDYVFMPIAISKKFKGKIGGVIFALIVSFSLVGLWHGAKWTFLFAGMLQGLAIAGGMLTKTPRKKIQSIITQRVYNFFCLLGTFFFMCFTFIFVFAPDFSAAIDILNGIFVSGKHKWIELGINKNDFFISVMLIVVLEVVQYLQAGKDASARFFKQPAAVRWAAYYLLLLGIIMFGVFTPNKFMYMQF